MGGPPARTVRRKQTTCVTAEAVPLLVRADLVTFPGLGMTCDFRGWSPVGKCLCLQVEAGTQARTGGNA